VEVRRGARRSNHSLSGQSKGAELLLEKTATRTDHNGVFVLPSERVLTLFRPSGWSLVQLSFQRAGYASYETNLSISVTITNTLSGEPLLNTGDIRLHPSSAL
jgi:hypothetical protein